MADNDNGGPASDGIQHPLTVTEARTFIAEEVRGDFDREVKQTRKKVVKVLASLCIFLGLGNAGAWLELRSRLLTQIQGQVDQAQEKVDEFSQRIRALDSGLNSQSLQYAQLCTNVSSLQAKATTIDCEMTVLRSQYGTLTAEVNGDAVTRFALAVKEAGSAPNAAAVINAISAQTEIRTAIEKLSTLTTSHGADVGELRRRIQEVAGGGLERGKPYYVYFTDKNGRKWFLMHKSMEPAYQTPIVLTRDPGDWVLRIEPKDTITP